jgi:glucose/arabinose dehydrogenase
MPQVSALEEVEVDIEPYVDVANLTGMAWREDDPGIYLSTQDGYVYRVVDGDLQPEPVIDLTSEVTPLLPGSERGLLDVAFDPIDGRMFVKYTDDVNSDSHIDSFEVREGQAVLDTRREVLFEEQPGVGHNGGQLVFDASGDLFVSFGDGGGSIGRDAQDMSNVHGTIIRITPHRDGPGYDVPSDNPHVGEDGVRPEIWVTGLRHPWRFSIDHPTGDMWIGDVGESDIEEINHLPAGERGWNFGWYFFEGTMQRHDDAPEDTVPPVFEYTHEEGVAVIGGYVYRGTEIPGLEGAYVFGDLTGVIWALGTDGAVQLPTRVSGALTSFGHGPDGELFVLTLREGAFRLVAAP